MAGGIKVGRLSVFAKYFSNYFCADKKISPMLNFTVNRQNGLFFNVFLGEISYYHSGNMRKLLRMEPPKATSIKA